MALTERKLSEITWDKPGDCAEGRLLRVQKVKYSDGVGTKYLIGDGQGKLFTFPGAAKLDVFLMRADVGKIIRVEYLGKETKEPKPGFSPAKLFCVSVDESSAQRIEDGGAPLITDDDIPF